MAAATAAAKRARLRESLAQERSVGPRSGEAIFI